MRKQYHFWPGSHGVDAWDVDRLIEMSSELPVDDIPIASIEEVDAVYWFDEHHPPTVRAVIEHSILIRDVDPAHPIILGHDGRVMDGMHRVARAIVDGRSTIRAVRFSDLVEPDYRNCSPGDLPYDRTD